MGLWSVAVAKYRIEGRLPRTEAAAAAPARGGAAGRGTALSSRYWLVPRKGSRSSLNKAALASDLTKMWSLPVRKSINANPQVQKEQHKRAE